MKANAWFYRSCVLAFLAMHGSGTLGCKKRFEKCPPDLGFFAKDNNRPQLTKRSEVDIPGREWRLVTVQDLQACLDENQGDKSEKVVPPNYLCERKYTYRGKPLELYLTFNETTCTFFCAGDEGYGPPREIVDREFEKFKIFLPTPYDGTGCRTMTCPPGRRDAVQVLSYKNGTLTETGEAKPEIQWRDTFGDEVRECLKQTSVTGTEIPSLLPQYICRAGHPQATWRIGKLLYNETRCDFTCDYVVKSEVEKRVVQNSLNAQLLMIPKETQKWVSLSHTRDMGDIENAVSTGRPWKYMICRGQFYNALTNTYEHALGYFDLEEMACVVSLDWNVSKRPNDVQILTLHDDWVILYPEPSFDTTEDYAYVNDGDFEN